MTTFAMVVEHGSFSAAAKALGLTKSTASKHVAELERKLGVRLIDRTSRTRAEPHRLRSSQGAPARSTPTPPPLQ
jgi:DNA-binding transcriptional LysR family regulator